VHLSLAEYNSEMNEKMLHLAKECGIMLSRDDMHLRWRNVEPTPGGWDFKDADELFARVKKSGIRLIVNLGCPPVYGRAPYYTPLDPKSARSDSMLPDADLFAAYAAKVAQRYGDQVMFWEISNEPDLLMFANYSLNDYIKLLRTSNLAIKKVRPDALVMNGGIASIDGHNSEVEPDYLKKFLQRTPADAYDVFAFHFHSIPKYYRRQVQELMELRSVNPAPKPFFPDETAHPCGPQYVTQYEQAEILWKKLLFSWANGTRGYVWYNFRCTIYHADDNGEANYGLVSKDLHPRPAYVAYHTLTKYFAGAKFVRTLRDDNEVEFYLFRAPDGSWLIPFWTLIPDYRKLWLVTGVGDKAELIDLWGNVSPNQSSDVAYVKVGTRPMLLRIPNQQEEPKLKGQLISVAKEIFVPRNDLLKNTLLLSNNFKTRWQGTLTISAPDYLRISPKEIAFDLAPSASGEYPFKVEFNTESGDLSAPTDQLTVRFNSRLLNNAQVGFPIRSALIVKDQYTSEPIFELKNGNQIFHCFPSSGENEKYFWRSPDDLSAKIYLKTDRKALYIRSVVCDDVHQSPSKGKELWKGDSIQLAFAIQKQKGEWKFGFSLADDGSIQKYCWDAPNGFNSDRCIADINAQITRNQAARTTTYEVMIPFRSIGLSNNAGKNGFRFSMVVNDRDIDARESIMFLSDGIANGALNANLWPVICF